MKIEKTNAIPVPAFSPPDNKLIFFTSLPGGLAIILTPVLKRSFSVSSRYAFPPPKILVKKELRLELILSNISLNLDLVSESIFLIAFSNVETEDERSSYCSSKYFFLSF